MSKRMAIGIDLGTTNSCAGFFRNEKVDIVYNDMGNRITPSYVSFTSEEIFVGDAAKEEALVNPENTVFENKRLIGRKFTDDTVQRDIKQWPFEVFGEGGSPKIRVQYKEAEKVCVPEQISAMILKKVKEDAEAATGETIQDAVITVPAYFNDSQRQATIDAGKIAGLNVLSIINEPTAAALAYGFDKKVILNQNVLVFDFGGGTFDVSIVSIADKNYSVVAVGGDTHLGGGDIDYLLVDHIIEVIKRKHNKDLSGNQRALGRLRRACEVAKIRLTKASKATVIVDALFDGNNVQETVSRAKFDDLCADLFTKAIDIVKSMLEDSNLSKGDIDEVILVGGSSRIPKIQELLSEYFDGRKLNKTINPDEAVAYGAAVKAALASGDRTIEEITLADVVPLSLGKSNSKGVMKTFIKRNSRIPITVVQKNWTTTKDYLTALHPKIYEGERKLVKDNNCLGQFTYELGERELAGVAKITYIFTVDDNGILHVSGKNRNTKCSGGVSLTSNKGRLKKEEIERMVQEAKTSTAEGQ